MRDRLPIYDDDHFRLGCKQYLDTGLYASLRLQSEYGNKDTHRQTHDEMHRWHAQTHDETGQVL